LEQRLKLAMAGSCNCSGRGGMMVAAGGYEHAQGQETEGITLLFMELLTRFDRLFSEVDCTCCKHTSSVGAALRVRV
jgi:hypothetical protein